MKGILLAAPLGSALLLAQPASAQEFPDRFALNIGESYIFDTNTEFSARSSGGVIGTTIDFERDLNGEKQLGTPRIDGYFRFSPHHRLDYAWIRINRKGSKTLSRDITFFDDTFNLSATVNSEIDASFTKLAYTWSFHHTDDVELGLTAGGVWADYSIKLSGLVNQVEESVDGPLPTLGFRLDYEISPRWHAKLKTDALYFDLGDSLKGSFDTTSVALEFRMARNIALGLGSERQALDATVDDGDFRGTVADFYRSTRFYVGVRF